MRRSVSEALAAAGLVGLLAGADLAPARADEVYLSEAEAPAAVFPDADRFDRQDVPSTPELRRWISERLGDTRPTLWESAYPVFAAYRNGARIGTAVIVEEIGKHRAITFVVGVAPDGRVEDVAVMAYREPYGGEVRSSRFLRQYRGKGLADPLRPGQDVRNVTGATLSARAIGRGVKKAIAVVEAIRERAPGGAPAPAGGDGGAGSVLPGDRP